MSLDIDEKQVEALLERLYLGGGAPRKEERKKAREVAGLLSLIARTIAQPAPRGHARTLVDAAAGHGYVGLCAAALLGWRRIVAIERDPDRIDRVRAAAQKLDVPIELELRAAALGAGAVPADADLVVALHACGPATDGVLADASAAAARWILCAPCCYGRAVSGWREAEVEAVARGLHRDAEVRAPYARAYIDSARLHSLERAGYEAKLIAFTTPTVSPHHLVIQARRGGYVNSLA
jgi:Methyltransferase domain